MTGMQTETAHGTVRLPHEQSAWRSVQIRRSLKEVKDAWAKANLPGSAEFAPAPGDRGVNVSVELSEEADDQVEHALAPYDGQNIAERLETALRAFKAVLETGEVATTAGQPSGRRD